MGRLRVMSGRDVRRLLEESVFTKVRRREGHIVMQNKLSGTTVTVPVPDHKELLTGTLRSIIRQSGLPRSVFETGD